MCDFDGELRPLGPVPEDLLHRLDEKVAENPALWILADMKKRNRFKVFRGTTLHIVFQYPEDLRSHERSEYTDLWDEWRDVVAPLIDHATQAYDYAVGRTTRVMLAKLLAGKTIGGHVDGTPSAAVPHKIHIPLATEPGVRFFIGEGEYWLERGQAYEVNNRLRHAVRNETEKDRVHLIFDYFDGSTPQPVDPPVTAPR